MNDNITIIRLEISETDTKNKDSSNLKPGSLEAAAITGFAVGSLKETELSSMGFSTGAKIEDNIETGGIISHKMRYQTRLARKEAYNMGRNIRREGLKD